MNKTKLAFIGAGNMAGALIGGLVKQGFDASNISAADPYQPSLDKLRSDFAITTSNSNTDTVNAADVVVLAVKPQMLHTAAAEISALVRHQQSLVVSIAAGIPLASLQSWLGDDVAIVRCMPNMPALVQCGATGLFANSHVSDAQRAAAEQILNAVGISAWVNNESELDAVTAVSGSGPAYFFLVMEAMQDSADAMGLDPELSKQLIIQTALGAATMAQQSDVDAAELRRRVTSPGGTTERAIAELEGGGLRELFKIALRAAEQRSVELAQSSD